MYRSFVAALCLSAFYSLSAHSAAPAATPLPELPFKQGETILWYGSSSTSIGVWPRTIEFLFRTRHPELKLNFEREGKGGGTFALALPDMDDNLSGLKPNVVLFNFGGNDSSKGEKGVAAFKKTMKTAIDKVKAHGARPILMTPQPGDERLAGKRNDNLEPYSEAMMSFAKEQGIPCIDTHHPLEEMFLAAIQDQPDFTINKDTIHLTHSGYVAWGYFLYEALNAPAAESSVELSADGKVLQSTRCKISNVLAASGQLSFTREDEILPILPPNPLPMLNSTSTSTKAPKVPPSDALKYAQKHGYELPPRKHCPLEKHSRYMLKIAGLPVGNYTVSANGKPLGDTTAANLAQGVNLNSLLLDSGNPAPWADLTNELWRGKSLEKIGTTQFVFEVKKAQ